MARTRRTEEDAVIDAEIGRRVAELRTEQHWTLRALAERVGLSPTHLNALEVGKHPFSAALVLKLSVIFNEPTSKLLGEETPQGSLSEEWRTLFEILPARDQAVLVELARKLTNWAKTFSLETARRHRRHSGLIVAFEGIDGVLLRRLAYETKAELTGVLPVDVLTYDHGSELWRHLRARFQDPTQSPLERTLLFACERLLRQETAIRPALREDKVVLSPFFAMAPSVYQEVDGLGDRRLIDTIEAQVLQPDLVVLVYSSPVRAAAGATKSIPNDDQFYSPYSRPAEFDRALTLYRKATEEFTSRGHEVHEIELADVDLDQSPGRLRELVQVLAAKIQQLRDS